MESSCLSGLVYHPAACETTKRQVKNEVILNPVDNLGESESDVVPCQEYGFPSVTTDKAEAVKRKEEN